MFISHIVHMIRHVASLPFSFVNAIFGDDFNHKYATHVHESAAAVQGCCKWQSCQARIQVKLAENMYILIQGELKHHTCLYPR